MTKTYVEFICDICGNSSFKEHSGYELDEKTLTPIKTSVEETLPGGWLYFALKPKKNNAATATRMICICDGCKSDITYEVNGKI
jgi:hypothetical protein